MIMIPHVYQLDTPAAERAGENFIPPADALERMGKYNDELKKAGLLETLEGLNPIEKGARVSFADGKAKVTDGPFVESKEVVGGFWILKVKSKDEALSWAQRVPAEKGDVIELREIFDTADLPEDARQ